MNLAALATNLKLTCVYTIVYIVNSGAKPQWGDFPVLRNSDELSWSIALNEE